MSTPMKRHNFFLPDRIWEGLQHQAMAKQMTISEVIRQMLTKSLDLDVKK